jgi:hypothetical protein
MKENAAIQSGFGLCFPSIFPTQPKDRKSCRRDELRMFPEEIVSDAARAMQNSDMPTGYEA